MNYSERLNFLLKPLDIIETENNYYYIYDYCESGNLRYLLNKK